MVERYSVNQAKVRNLEVFLDLPHGFRKLELGPSSAALPSCINKQLDWKLEQPCLKPAPMWDAGIISKSFTHCAKGWPLL